MLILNECVSLVISHLYACDQSTLENSHKYLYACPFLVNWSSHFLVPFSCSKRQHTIIDFTTSMKKLALNLISYPHNVISMHVSTP